MSIKKPAENTCDWLFKHELYLDWCNGQNRDKHKGLLCLRGKPGTGKSVLMKEAIRQSTSEQDKSDCATAAFFFSAKGDELEQSPLGLFRSLICQLLSKDRDHLRGLCGLWDERKKDPSWQEAELETFFESMFAQQSAKRTIIFIDALDECVGRTRSQVYFWRKITESAYAAGVQLNVCFSSRHFPTVTVNDCPEIVIENCNSHDIALYVEQKFKLGMVTVEPRWELLRDKVMGKSDGVFLWVVLAVDDMLRRMDDGQALETLLWGFDTGPEALESLYSQMLFPFAETADERQLTVRLFQWAVLAAKPLRLHEWHHILAFIGQLPPSSLHKCGLSEPLNKQTDDQLEKNIRRISKGLVEVSARHNEPQDQGFETISVCARAGSLDMEDGETRIVQVIHDSVREFFLEGNGFSILDPSLESNPLGNGHLSIMATCLDYLDITELDALVQARDQAAQRENDRSSRQELFIFRFDLWSSPSPCPSPSTNKNPETEQTSAFETFKKSIDSAPHFNIVQWWLTTAQCAADQVSWNKSKCNSTAQLSVTGQSQKLEVYPALLSYATFEFFNHARLAEEKDADPRSILNRLMEKKNWDRWVTLREDVFRGVELVRYAANQGLSSWVGVIREQSYLDLSDVLETGIVDEWGAPMDSGGWSDMPSPNLSLGMEDDDGLFYLGCEPLSRAGSVASFGSAGSHTGSSNLWSKLNPNPAYAIDPKRPVESTDDKNKGGKAPFPELSYGRPKYAYFKCPECSADFWRGSELQDHLKDKHDGMVRKHGWICRDPADYGIEHTARAIKPLSECGDCANQKQYVRYWMAANHLRRTHLRVNELTQDDPKADTETRGDLPGWAELRNWTVEIRTPMDIAELEGLYEMPPRLLK